jgi:hypothetical protein
VDYTVNLRQLHALLPVMRTSNGLVGTLQPQMWQRYISWLVTHKLLKRGFQVTSTFVTNRFVM